MANVTGENAEDVSSYMTAIWNNFDDGSKSLEYFADVITKLGAETAASSAEIANGLEKFAAVGSTIGLSYEYATAALTTIIDKTRQSEDVVGTALKTIFARIQGLKMGEETEDGLDLNKYSSALAQYGIEIFDANRNLRDMDEILDDMGEKWGMLNRAQKVGLAQTVAGIRQYNQLVSLMDNWDAMQKNLGRAMGASGSLDEQADIYAESWEAASNRVRASLEAIYSDMIDDEFFIDVYNQLADLIDGVDNFIDSIGGMKTVLLGLGTVVLSMAKTKIGPALQDLALNVKVMTGGAQAAYNKINDETINTIDGIKGSTNFDKI
ncbi:MAG: phage tail tape measure protein [Firmicutes bacterium]|nr:phage tail tape measure protein [Bacillota bacterium]